MNGTPTDPFISNLLTSLRSADLQLDIPAHYGYGQQWDQRGWLDILSQLHPAVLQNLQLPDLFHQAGLAAQFGDEAAFWRDVFSGAPIGPMPTPPSPVPEAATTPDLTTQLMSLFQQPQTANPAPDSSALVGLLSPLLRQRIGQTTFYGNIPPPW